MAGDGHIPVSTQRYEYLDGSIEKKSLGFRRLFTIDLGVLTDGDDLDFVGNFLNSESQFVSAFSYTGTGGTVSEVDIRVVDNHPTWESTWRDAAEVGRQIILSLEENTVRVGWPSEQGYGYSYGADYGDNL